ncbi:phosphoribosylaminoimidazolesuccinocarboxamide synthase [Bradymonas sediminis]|uniref:Phosphoribosylaminoimidazole-succinocarboxamide synthase n=1 Tax=Bradymonas sediminis TaxID=1548548 RepID=A0A2Z4FKY1_9DELT|nr:phosphoribosylaminoimidazolesuccinocarboxamide synthase [Bradymonas sediminis]AWV89651.1 phosphoribosylaminoimidazolesuccinocarboxamide synthase [Bradymonas sediminis]TDP76609.1 phosphoribosylaminoimidazole-succinocarboxamide synthase [Bradymonas sediminis]
MTHFDIAYEGKAKQLLIIDGDPEHYVQRFKDDATAFNGEKSAKFRGKGVLNCAISSFIFEKLEAAGVCTHYVEQQNPIDMLVRKLEIIPLEVVVRNVVAGNLGRRTGLAAGSAVEPPIVETYYKNDALGDPLFADTHIEMLGLVDAANLARIKETAFQVNTILGPIFAEAGIRLADFKIEFGIDAGGRAILGDEISPDTCRLWDMETGESFDKDVFRYDRGDLIKAYQEIARRLELSLPVEV